MRVYIPTFRRMEPTTQHTFKALPESWQMRTTFVVDDADFKKLENIRSFNPRYRTASALVVPAEVNTIAKKRAFIIQQAKEDKIVMFDDDLRFAVRKYDDTGAFKLRPATVFDIDDAMKQLAAQLDTWAHAGFSARQGNNRLDPGWLHGRRMMYTLGYRPAVLREHCELGRIETREDFDYTLQLFRKGFTNAVSSEMCVDQTYNAKGGCSEQRTMEASNADALKLAELHPGLVKVVDKDYKTSVPRKEVIVSWKKALDAGLRVSSDLS